MQIYYIIVRALVYEHINIDCALDRIAALCLSEDSTFALIALGVLVGAVVGDHHRVVIVAVAVVPHACAILEMRI